MSLVTQSNVSVDMSNAMYNTQITGLLAGEDLLAGAPCKVKSDGLVWMSVSSGSDAYVEPVHGWTMRAVDSGEPVTLIGNGARFRYGSSLTPGAKYYVAETAGRLDTAATDGDASGVAVAITSTDIMVRTRIG